jgi:hypothetical protein
MLGHELFDEPVGVALARLVKPRAHAPSRGQETAPPV